MSYPFNYPTPTNANIQIFSEPATSKLSATWTKPSGASFVWFTLIGAGGGGANTDGTYTGGAGGSATITNCMVPAFLIPDDLSVIVGAGGVGGVASGAAGGTGGASSIYYVAKQSSGYLLLSANGGGGGPLNSYGTGGSAVASNYFSCMGLYQSISGQNGASDTTPLPTSSTTFLGAGQIYNGGYLGQYRYETTNNVATGQKQSGFFQLQPIIVGLGGSNTAFAFGNGGIGCGGAGVLTTDISGPGGNGGNGLVVIITW